MRFTYNGSNTDLSHMKMVDKQKRFTPSPKPVLHQIPIIQTVQTQFRCHQIVKSAYRNLHGRCSKNGNIHLTPLKVKIRNDLIQMINMDKSFGQKKVGDFSKRHGLPYFFGYKTEFFSIQNNPKNLDPSCKMDLDLWDCLRRAKLVL